VIQAPPPEPDALAEEARVDDLYRTVPLALWFATAVGVGQAAGVIDVLVVHDAREWIPPGGTLSTWWGWQPPSLATRAHETLAIGVALWLSARLFARLLRLRPALPTTSTGRSTVAAASALAFGISMTILATDRCSTLALDWSGSRAEPWMVGSSLLLGGASAALGLRALLGGLERVSWWLLELDAVVLVLGSSLAGLWVVYTAVRG